MELKIDFKWTQMDANGMFKMSAERHKIIITGWYITRKTIKSLKKQWKETENQYEKSQICTIRGKMIKKKLKGFH